MAIKAIIWDVGGVMERTEDHNPRKALAARLGWEPTDLENLIFGNNDNHRASLNRFDRLVNGNDSHLLAIQADQTDLTDGNFAIQAILFWCSDNLFLPKNKACLTRKHRQYRCSTIGQALNSSDARPLRSSAVRTPRR